ncbi:MAG: type II/IV secretion system ATPase subunit [Methanospirillum sp.]|uniref:type II/IV secretion system ATPase subunit n=1 Tax=Methanospirillum sp. TaxID=45200 RepID=UPI0023711B82|nr:type II/IV secretion system ATPase subunit [Methanospirillum sp.]MDD1728467.1 type II/IV secretion system ATPase subunit [Methanospirillum sp.]
MVGDGDEKPRAIATNTSGGQKKKRTITIKVPHIFLGKKTSSDEKTVSKIKKTTFSPTVASIPLPIKPLKPPVSKNQDISKINRIKVSPILQKREDPVVITNKELKKSLGTERESRDLNYSSKLLKKFSLSRKSGIEEYNFEKHGSLVEAEVPAGYELIREYWADPGRALIYIALNTNSRMKEYLLYEPALSPFEYELLERLHEDLRDVLILTDDEVGMDRRFLLLTKMMDLLNYYGVTIGQRSLFKIEYFLVRNYIGWGRINALMNDPWIEDISCDGDNIPIFLFHRKEQNIKTNIQFETEALVSLAITLAQRSGKHISSANPMIDATLPEGSRLQLTFGTEVTSRGTSFTIRKFREQPFTPIDLMDLKTFSADMLAYFWLAIENNMSLVFIGGTASGKTTSLNAVSLFIPPLAKVISIEDTRELTLYHENWIASITRDSVGESGTSVDMFMLLKAAMRQRPEYILVGEVRGHEAQTLFQAMNTGHTTFSTMHAGSVDAAIHRLENEPLNVPRNMLQALNVLSIQKQIQIGPDRVRRSEEIVEIAGIDPATGNIMVNTVFEYDPLADSFGYTGRSQVLGDIATLQGWSREALLEEMERRKQVLNAIKDQDLRDYIRFTKIIQAYYIDKERVFDNINDLSRIAT